MQSYAVTARAPGKIILSGEHAVVYGRPAIALAIDRYATTTITPQSGYGIWFEFLNDELKHVATMEELQDLKTQISKRYRKFTVGKCQIRDVIRNPLELIQYTFIYLVEHLSLATKGGLKIQIELTLPIGCGMGASASVILSVMHALINYCGQTLTVDKYLYFGREIENLQHGRSSGLDLFLSLHGGCYFFNAGNANKRSLPNLPFVLVNTGKAETSTGECVESVAKHLQDGVLADEFSNTALAFDLALRQHNLAMVKECVRRNHELLLAIEVVPKRVADFIAAVEVRGNVAKVSGAGAISGDSAGVVLVVGEAEISDLVAEYGYTTLSVNGESSGVCLI